MVGGGPSATRGGYLLTQWNVVTLLVVRSVVIYTTEMSKTCPVVEYVAIIVIRRTAETTGPITKWPARRLLFFRLEIVFVTISLFAKRTNVVQKAL